MSAIPVEVSQGAVLTVWIVSLVLALVVAAVVAILLEMVRRTAVDILNGAGAIWTHGKLVARDTVQIVLFLSTTNAVVSQILEAARQSVGAANAIEQHAEGCPGCPQCVLGPQAGG
jgi:hypothetical protein